MFMCNNNNQKKEAIDLRGGQQSHWREESDMERVGGRDGREKIM